MCELIPFPFCWICQPQNWPACSEDAQDTNVKIHKTFAIIILIFDMASFNDKCHCIDKLYDFHKF